MENSAHHELNNPIIDNEQAVDETLGLLTSSTSKQLAEYRKSMSLRRSQRENSSATQSQDVANKNPYQPPSLTSRSSEKLLTGADYSLQTSTARAEMNRSLSTANQ